VLRRSSPGPARVALLPAPAALAGAVLLAGLLGGLLTGCSSDAPPPVDVGTVGRATVTEVVEAPATVAARASASVTAPAAATVTALDVADGQTVRAGQVLLRLDSPAARQALDAATKADEQAAAAGSGGGVPRIDLAALRRPDPTADQAFAEARQAAGAIPDPQLRTQAIAQISAAQADHRAARVALARAVDQLGAGLGSLTQLTSSLAKAQRAQTRASVAVARAGVDALTVRAPIDGTVVLGGSGPASAGSAPDVSSVLQQLPAGVQAQAQALLPSGGAGGAGAGGGSATVVGLPAVGVPVSSGAPLLTVTDVSALSLTASVDETDVLQVLPGVTADVELDAVPGAVYPASVRSVDLQPTTSSRGGVSYGVRLSLGAGRTEAGEPAPVPRPGMSAVARLKVRTAADAVSVPASAVVRDDARDTVWVVDAGRARRREVRLGAQGDEQVQVTSGLVVGDRVVVRGADRVAEGQQVGDR